MMNPSDNNLLNFTGTDFPAIHTKGRHKKTSDIPPQESRAPIQIAWGKSLQSPPSSQALSIKKPIQEKIPQISSSNQSQKIDELASSIHPTADIHKKKGNQDLLIIERTYPKISLILKFTKSKDEKLLKKIQSSLDESTNFESAHKIYKKALEEGNAGLYVFNTAMRVFSRQGHPSYFLEVLDHMKQAQVDPDIGFFNTLIKFYSKKNDLQNTLNCFNETKQYKIAPTNDTFNSLILLFNQLINGCADKQKPEKALELYHLMEIHGVPSDGYTFGALIKAFVNVKDMENAIMLYNQMDKKAIAPNTIIFNILLNGAIESRRNDLIPFFLSEMSKRGVCQDDRTESILLKQKTNIKDAIESLKKSPSSSHVSFHTVITLCMREGKVQLAFELFSIMKTKQLQNVVTYHVLMNGLIENGLVKEAFDLFEELLNCEFSLEPTVTTYNILIKGCGTIKDLSKAIGFIEKMKNQGLTPDVQTFNTVISICGITKNLNLALQFFEEMKLAHIFPDRCTYETLFSAGVKLKETEKALKIKTEMEGRDMSIGAHGYTSLMTEYNSIQEFGKTLQMYALILKNNLTLDLQAYTCVIKAYCSAHRIDEALQLFEKMKTTSIKPDKVLFAALINGCIDEDRMDDAFRLLIEMDQAKERSEKAKFYGLLNGLIKANQIENAETVYTLLKSMGHKEDLLEQMRIDLYVAKGDLEAALNLFEMLFKTCKTDMPDSVDCHHLPRGAAFANVAFYIKSYPNKPFQIITGIGLHSKDEPLKMQEYILEHLKKFYDHLIVAQDTENKGLLHVSY